MNTKQSILSIFVTAALSLPFAAFASDYTHNVPGSTDEARAMAAQPEHVESYLTPNAYALSRAGSTDAAREINGEHQVEPVTQPAACPTPVASSRASTTDEARADMGRRLDLALQDCTTTQG